MDLVEALDIGPAVKDYVINLLLSEGFGTYVKYFEVLKFHCVHEYKGTYCPVAFMCEEDMCIVVNPAFTVDMFDNGPIFKQLSVVIRHELLHFLLEHEKRFADYLKKVDKNFARNYHRLDLHTIANFAMDYELGDLGYDEHDKEVVRNLTLNGTLLGGLLSEEVKNSTTKIYGRGIAGVEILTSDKFNNWGDKTMEEMFQMLRDEHEKLLKAKGIDPEHPKSSKTTINIKKETHSQEYTDIYNKVIQKYGSKSTTDKELEDLLARATNGEDIV